MKHSTIFFLITFLTYNYQYTPSDPSFDLYPTAVKYAWQIRAANQFGNPVTVNDGRSDVFCLAFNSNTGDPLAVSGAIGGCEENSGSVILTVTGGTGLSTYSCNKDGVPGPALTAAVSNFFNGKNTVSVTGAAGRIIT